MPDEPVSEPVDVNTVAAPSKYLDTIFKSSYWYGKKLCQLFVNYNVGGHRSFSFVAKNGPITLIHNIATENKLPLIRNMLAQLSPEELELVLKKD